MQACSRRYITRETRSGCQQEANFTSTMGAGIDPFAEPPAAAPARRQSLFSIVTGAFKSTPAAVAEPAPALVAAAPLRRQPDPVYADDQQAASPERDLEIPTFLRRQAAPAAVSNAPQKDPYHQ